MHDPKTYSQLIRNKSIFSSCSKLFTILNSDVAWAGLSNSIEKFLCQSTLGLRKHCLMHANNFLESSIKTSLCCFSYSLENKRVEFQKHYSGQGGVYWFTNSYTAREDMRAAA